MLSEFTVRATSSISPSRPSCSASEKSTSKATTFAPSRDKASMSAAMRERDHGQRPSLSRLFSSIAAITTAFPGGSAPRARKRRSSQFSSIASNRDGEKAKSAATRLMVPTVRDAGLNSHGARNRSSEPIMPSKAFTGSIYHLPAMLRFDPSLRQLLPPPGSGGREPRTTTRQS